MMAGIDQVLKRIPDDVVEYYIYPPISSDIFDEEEILANLEKQQDAILAHISDKIVNYIWQHEPFCLAPITSPSGGSPPHLHGSTNFGDSIDDEWFIVSLLYEITREFASTVVRVKDNDEEFLLIEAAESLPKWLDPETAENRVYVYNGDLHAIPIPQSPEEFSKYPIFSPSITEGLECIRDCACETRCSQAVQNSINTRLSQFPRKLKENIHNVNCYLPISLAALLSDQPTLVSVAVRRFYYRDPLELKACRPMKRFTPKDLVRTRVKMTRCLYAQLVQQEFTPDRQDCWPIVNPSSKEYSERDIGMKLAHGFEILCHKCPEDGVVINNQIQDTNNPRWQQFKKSLRDKGYFRKEIEGSKLYKQLLEDAKRFYLSHIFQDQSNHENIGLKVLKHIKRLEPTFNNFRNEQDLPPSDDDKWLHVTPEQVDEMMKSAGSIGSSESSETFDLSKIAQSMSAFVDHESSIDGAEFPKDCKEPEGDGDGQFQSSGLIHQMQKIFEFSDDEDSSGSDMSEYDWSENSEDDTGSPTKMSSDIRRGSKPSSKILRSNLKKDSLPKEPRSKSVRFSTPDTSSNVSESPVSPTSPSPTSPVMKSPVVSTPPAVPPRPGKLPVLSPPSRPSQPPPPRPATLPTRPSSKPTSPPPPVPKNSNPPPLPPEPPKRQIKPRTISRPNASIKPDAPPPPPPPPRPKRDKKLEALMNAMDRELAATDVGKSFERFPKQKNDKKETRNGKRDQAYRDIDDEEEDFCPVNVDLNVVKNTLESYKAQQGLPGPATNILSGFGVKLPQDNGKT